VRASSVHTPALTLAETQDLIAAARAATYSDRDLAIVLLLVSTGLRVSELCAADLEDVSNDSGTFMLRIRAGKGRKTRSVAFPLCQPRVRQLIAENH